MSTINWFDLSPYGLSAKVIPKSLFRDEPLVCIGQANAELTGERLYELYFGVRFADDDPAHRGERVRDRNDMFHAAMLDAGFSYAFDSGHYMAPKSIVSLELLQRVIPTLDADCIVAMPRDAVLLDAKFLIERELDESRVLSAETRDVIEKDRSDRRERYATNEPLWQRFASTHLADASSSVFMDSAQLPIKPWASSGPLRDAVSAFNAERNNGVYFHPDYQSVTRDNALVTYYTTRERAIADGIDEASIAQVTLPYALPVGFSLDRTKFLAIRDYRGVPDIAESSPAQRFGRYADNASVDNLYIGATQYREIFAAMINAQAVAKDAWLALASTCRDDASTPDQIKEKASAAAIAMQPVFEHAAKHKLAAFEDFGMMFDPDMKSYQADNFPLLLSQLAQYKLERPRFLRAVLNITVSKEFEPIDYTTLIDAAPIILAQLSDADKALANERAEAQREVERKETAERAAKREKVSARDDKKQVIDDAGEKIGGARKDFAKRGLCADELSQMTELERKTLTVKGNIWPPLNYRAMRDEGLSPQVAYAIKVVKDLLPTTFTAPHGSEREAMAFQTEYIEAVTKVRDEFAGVESLDDIAAALHRINCWRVGIDEPAIGDVMDSDIKGYDTCNTYDRQIGRKFCKLLTSATDYERANRHSNSSDILFKGVNLPYDLSYAVRNKMPDSRLIWNGEISKYETRDIPVEKQWAVLIKPTANKKSEEELAAAKEARDRDMHLHRPHLATVTREGNDWRHGADITPDDFINDFGFRAVEFGNWLPQDERQTVLNMAYDAFCDLSQALNLPRKALSLGDDLAIAFGSRGTGGRSAALAHFEPARNVINLTRMSGAGCLAHEWFHALDFALANKAGYESERLRSDFAGPMRQLVNAMQLQGRTFKEAASEYEAAFEKGINWALSWAQNRLNEPHNTPAGIAAFKDSMTAFAKAAFQAHRDALVSGAEELVATNAESPVMELKSIFISHLDALNKAGSDFIDKAVKSSTMRGKPLRQFKMNTADWLHNAVAANERAAFDVIAPTLPPDEAAKLKHTFCGSAKSQFLVDAEALDKTRSKPYWATTLELFARAGAAYVEDTLAEQGIRSDYLVFGAGEDVHTGASPNPRGENRVAINQAFNELLNAYRLEAIKTLDAVDESATCTP